MNKKHLIFSPVTRLSGLLSVDVFLEKGVVREAKASSTFFRGFEWIMKGRQITDAVYLTQRICGICSLAHGAVSSYLVDKIYDNEISENAQYLRNIMFAADFLQNHIRHFYIFSIPDYVRMPSHPPFHGQNKADLRLDEKQNRSIAENYFEAVKASQRCHEILALFGGKAPHQHSFLFGGVTAAPTADKINRALALLSSIKEFIHSRMLPDTEIIAHAYNDYFYNHCYTSRQYEKAQLKLKKDTFLSRIFSFIFNKRALFEKGMEPFEPITHNKKGKCNQYNTASSSQTKLIGGGQA